jgi:hypothetical protein
MQPFQGVLEGNGQATFELKMDRGDLQHLRIDGAIGAGILGAELLKGIVDQLEPSPTRDVLASLAEWHFKNATLDFSYKENYYDRRTAAAKFNNSSNRYEVLGNIVVKGPARSSSSPMSGDNLLLHRLNPINIFLNMLQIELKIEGMQMRLLMDRVGRKK